ncbi:MAG: DUF1553 domain-containing protein [Gemmataceae bacterium]|nr:DUF1553 domain-containing protein [Gemmataceae bacterium]
MRRYLLIPLGVSALMAFRVPSLSAAENPVAPSYSRHVSAVFSRLGCNGGTCHGAVKGQNGFKLSLFGGDLTSDYERLLREAEGRRLNVSDPDASLLLLKATGQVAHQGGKRMAVGSPEYEVLKRWMAAGAAMDSLDRSRVSELRITPAEHTVKPGDTYRLRVEAKFADGSTEDVTPLCSYESLDQAVATVESNGQVKAEGVGDAALVVRFRAEPAMAMLVVPRQSADPFPEINGNNFVDQHVLAKLRRLNIPPSDVADDTTFLRRASLDVTGELPTPKEVRAFLADKDPRKRGKKIDELLGRPGYAALWTLKFCDLLKATDFGVYADGMRQEVDAPRFQAWVRARMDENVPYDQFVERILTATSREGKSVEGWARDVMAMQEGYAPGRKDVEMYRQRKTLDLYWQRSSSTGVPAALQVTHAFLGIRLECAQCHRHPHDVWQQDDLLSFANFFMGVRKIGFQGDNEKKFPEVAAMTKQLTDEGKRLADQAKHLRDVHVKKLETEVKQAPSEALLKTQLEAIKNEAARMENRGKLVDEVTRRLMHAEVRMVAGGPVASVTSPIGTQSSSRHRLLGQTEAVEVGKDQDPRQLVMAWLRRADNPYFAKSIVNRVWAHYFGRGIIDPPDNLSSFNPATHPELLKELSDGFIKNGYDLKWLHRTILNSRTYQQSSMATKANDIDRSNYAYFYYRRMPAEVLVDALNQVTGTTEKMDMLYQHWPNEIKTVEIPFAPKNSFVTFMLDNFGKPKRNSAVQCDCERDGNASVLQVLSFANHPRVWAKVTDDKGEVARIAKDLKDDKERIEEVCLLTLGRLPKEAEMAACQKYLKDSESTVKGLQGIMWSLLNTREFVLQH